MIKRETKPVERLTVGLDLEGEVRPVGTLAWSRERRVAFFQYDPAFAARPLPLSPFHLPVTGEPRPASAARFYGLHGAFNDSLPDGWGRLLADRWLTRNGIDHRSLTPLDRLALVGRRGVGALTYAPGRPIDKAAPPAIDFDDLAAESALVLAEVDTANIDLLRRIQGSSGGARPKIMVGIHPGTAMVAPDLGLGLPAGHEAWMIKFAAQGDPVWIGAEEYAYSLMAKAAGVEMPETRLMRTDRGGRYFAVRRFDRAAEGRRHVLTVAALLETSHTDYGLDYDTLFKATRLLTRDERDVRQMFRRMLFNVFARNRDDHARNHGFLMSATGEWRPTPAYDLTLSAGPGGEHSLAIAGEGRNPGAADIARSAADASIPKGELAAMIDAVRAAIARWPSFAAEAEVPTARVAEIDRLLNPKAA